MRAISFFPFNSFVPTQEQEEKSMMTPIKAPSFFAALRVIRDPINFFSISFRFPLFSFEVVLKPAGRPADRPTCLSVCLSVCLSFVLLLLYV